MPHLASLAALVLATAGASADTGARPPAPSTVEDEIEIEADEAIDDGTGEPEPTECWTADEWNTCIKHFPPEWCANWEDAGVLFDDLPI